MNDWNGIGPNWSKSLVQLVQIAILGGFGGEKAQKPQKHLDETDTLIKMGIIN